MDSGDQRKTPVSPSTWLPALVLSGISLIATAVLYSRLPETIPVHWNITGEVDNFGPRWMSWIFGSLPCTLICFITERRSRSKMRSLSSARLRFFRIKKLPQAFYKLHGSLSNTGRSVFTSQRSGKISFFLPSA